MREFFTVTANIAAIDPEEVARMAESAQLGAFPIIMPRGVTAARTYDTERFCDHCDDDTPHTVYESGHERDSSHDWQRCHRCDWRCSGMTGQYEPP